MGDWDQYIPWSGSPESGTRFDSISSVLGLFLNLFLGAGIAISLIAVVVSGIKYITAGGDIKATADAKQALTYSVVAMVLVLVAFTVKNLILNLLGADSVGSYNLYDEVPNF